MIKINLNNKIQKKSMKNNQRKKIKMNYQKNKKKNDNIYKQNYVRKIYNLFIKNYLFIF